MEYLQWDEPAATFSEEPPPPSDEPAAKASSESPRGELLADISREMVRLYKECYGRGPTKARTVIQDDIVACVLEGGFQRGEQTLRDAGRVDAVVMARTAFQEALRHKFAESIERLTGRRVRSFMSGVDVDSEMCSEVFALEPADPDLGDPGEAIEAMSRQARRHARHVRAETAASRKRAQESKPPKP